MRILIAAVLFLGVISTNVKAVARLGETRADCDRRYGEPTVIHDDNVIEYKKNGIIVMCAFTGKNSAAVCEGLSYSNIDEDLGFVPITSKQVEYLLQNNSQGFRWSRAVSKKDPLLNKETLVWIRADGAKANATLSMGMIGFKSATLVEREAKDKVGAFKGF